MKLHLALFAIVISIGACVTVNTGPSCPCDGTGGTTATTTVNTVSAVASATASSSTGDDETCSGPFCAAWLGGTATTVTVCPASFPRVDALLACACTGLCASACGVPGAYDCLTAWGGNPPLSCKTCLQSATGCGPEREACVTDDGMTSASSSASTSASASSGGSCTCDPAILACPGGGSCLHIGDVGPTPDNGACGTAQVCVPCCNLGANCGTEGKCQITKISGEPCSASYECCSGVCSSGACLGGCGVILPGSGAGSSSSG